MIKMQKGMFTTVPVLCVEGQSPYIQTLYMRLCKYMNDDGQCRPSINTLCKKTGMSKNTVLKSAKDLEKLGLLKKTNRNKGNEYTSNMYDVYIELPKGGSSSGEPPSAGDEQGGGAGGEPPSAGDGNKLNHITKSISLTKKDSIINNTTPSVDGDDTTTGIIVGDEELNTPLPPSFGNPQINEILEIIKSECKANGIMYGADGMERNYAKHILSKKFTNDILEQTGYELKPFLRAIIMLSTQVKYAKTINSAKTIYYNRADTVNKAKKENIQVQGTQKRVFTY